MKALVFELSEDNADFVMSLCHGKVPENIIVDENGECQYLVTHAGADGINELITQEEFETRGYDKFNCGGWVTMIH